MGALDTPWNAIGSLSLDAQPGLKRAEELVFKQP
jgi:hypothetical protein